MISFEIDQSIIPEADQLSQEILHAFENAFSDRDEEGDIAIRFISDHETKNLNRRYREKDEVTDVLSFMYKEDGKFSDQIGDVVISYEQAKRQAHGDVQIEIIDLMVHGVLHVLGYDHEKSEDAKIMFPIQDKLVNEII